MPRLVKLVENDDVEFFERGIVMQKPEQDARRDDEEPGRRPRLPIEADVVADRGAEADVSFESHAPRRRSHCQPSRLEEKDAAELEQGRRDARRLAGPGRRAEDEGRRLAQTADDVGDKRIDRQRFGHIGHDMDESVVGLFSARTWSSSRRWFSKERKDSRPGSSASRLQAL